MTRLAGDTENHKIQAIRPNLLQSTPVTVANHVLTNPCDGGSTTVVIGSTVDCLIAIGAAPDALVAPTGFLFAGAMLYIRDVAGKDKIAFTRMPSAISDGVAYCMEDTDQ